MSKAFLSQVLKESVDLTGAAANRAAGDLMDAIVKELKKYPDADFVEVVDRDQHVRIRTRGGKLQIDVDAPGQKVHVLCPLSAIEDVTSQLEEHAPGA